jgi:hypothetical protein
MDMVLGMVFFGEWRLTLITCLALREQSSSTNLEISYLAFWISLANWPRPKRSYYKERVLLKTFLTQFGPTLAQLQQTPYPTPTRKVGAEVKKTHF